MIRAKELIIGLAILTSYEAEKYSEVNVDYDRLWAGPEGNIGPITIEDQNTLIANGWGYDETIERWCLD